VPHGGQQHLLGGQDPARLFQQTGRTGQLAGPVERRGGPQNHPLLRMDHHAQSRRATAEQAPPAVRAPGRLGPANQAPGASAPISERPRHQALHHHQCRCYRAQLAGSQHHHQRGSALEPGGTRTTHRPGAPHGAEAPGPGLFAGYRGNA